MSGKSGLDPVKCSVPYCGGAIILDRRQDLVCTNGGRAHYEGEPRLVMIACPTCNGRQVHKGKPCTGRAGTGEVQVLRRPAPRHPGNTRGDV